MVTLKWQLSFFVARQEGVVHAEDSGLGFGAAFFALLQNRPLVPVSIGPTFMTLRCWF
jgi:hypothetical protein